jgi:four helix bundle protein
MAFKFEDLVIWQESVEFAKDIYSLTKDFPQTEQFGIISQLNRAGVSISLNIAEGSGRASHAELARFIQISIGSLNEIVTLLTISRDQMYLSQKDFEIYYSKCERLSKMLHAFKNSLKR